MQGITRDQIRELVIKSIEAYHEENGLSIDLSNGDKTRLFGGDGQLDSISLVSLVVYIEEAFESHFNISIILADEKAMSRRLSPFSSLGNFVDYIAELIYSYNN